MQQRTRPLRQMVGDAFRRRRTSCDITRPERPAAIFTKAGAVMNNDFEDIRRERKLRRLARSHGLALRKARGGASRGTFALVDPNTNWLVAWGHPEGYGLDLDTIERELTDQIEETE